MTEKLSHDVFLRIFTLFKSVKLAAEYYLSEILPVSGPLQKRLWWRIALGLNDNNHTLY